MSRIQAIATQHAPAAIGPYSQAVVVGDLLFTSGQLSIDPATGRVVDGDIAAQAHQAFKNLAAIAAAAGASLQDSIKTTVYLADMNDFKTVNEIYATYFAAPYPARSAFQVAALPLAGKIEVEAIININVMSPQTSKGSQ